MKHREFIEDRLSITSSDECWCSRLWVSMLTYGQRQSRVSRLNNEQMILLGVADKPNAYLEKVFRFRLQ